MSEAIALESILRRERAIGIALLSLVVAGCWLYLLSGAGMGMSAWNMTSLEMALGIAPEMGMAMDGARDWPGRPQESDLRSRASDRSEANAHLQASRQGDTRRQAEAPCPTTIS